MHTERDKFCDHQRPKASGDQRPRSIVQRPAAKVNRAVQPGASGHQRTSPRLPKYLHPLHPALFAPSSDLAQRAQARHRAPMQCACYSVGHKRESQPETLLKLQRISAFLRPQLRFEPVEQFARPTHRCDCGPEPRRGPFDYLFVSFSVWLRRSWTNISTGVAAHPANASGTFWPHLFSPARPRLSLFGQNVEHISGCRNMW